MFEDFSQYASRADVDQLRALIHNLRGDFEDGGGGGSGAQPFKLVAGTSGTDATIQVSFGQVNDQTPTLGGTPIDNSTPPLITISSATTTVIYLRYEVDTGTREFVSVVVLSGASQPADTSAYGYITLGTAVTTTASGNTTVTTLNQSVTHSLRHALCGSDPDTWEHQFWGV